MSNSAESSSGAAPAVQQAAAAGEPPPKKEEEQQQQPLKPTTDDDGAASAAAPVPMKSGDTDTDADAEDVEDDQDDPDEDEGFLRTLEQEKEEHDKEEATHPLEQPHGTAAAPKLLQDALKKGEVKLDDSEEEEEKTGGKTSEGSAGETKKKKKVKEEESGEEKKEEEGHHVHQRETQLDFLLNKASQYSAFISQDLSELQQSSTAKAQKEMKKAEKAAKKKRKKSGEPSSSRKKSKKNSGEAQAALQSAHAKHNANYVGENVNAIFIQPRNLAAGCHLKDYQLEGLRWLVSLFENGVSGILADEMGLGKTIQVIAMIAHMRTNGVSGPFIVCAPLATLPNWVREFEKWLPDFPCVRFHGSAPERDAMIAGPLNHKHKKSDNFPVIVTSYEVAIREEKRLSKIGEFTYLVVDEGQRLKNHRCTLIQSLKRIPAANRLLLSGTPIQNNLDELWSLLNFVNPAIFDDLSVFQSWFGFRDIGQKGKGATDEEAILVEQRKNKTVSKLHDILRPFLLRRIKKDVLKDMPPKKEIVVYAGMSKLQLGYSDMIEQGVLRDVLLNQGIQQARTLSQTNKQMNQRKNCNHPFMFGEPIDRATGVHLGTSHPELLIRASGKFALLDRMLVRLHADKHQVLIFSQMTSLLNVIEDYLLYRHWKYCRIDGSTKIDDRQKAMDVFNAEKTAGADGTRNDNDDRHFVFLLSTRAGGLGINLATADTCIIFDSDWNPHQDSQAMDRCHRIGQNRPVAVYRLLTANSVDIEMMEKQISKKKLERMAIVGGDFRKAGSRSRGEFKSESLDALLKDDISDLQAKTASDTMNIRIDDEEFECILDRERLFAEGKKAVLTEGKMYDIVNSETDVLGAMNG